LQVKSHTIRLLKYWLLLVILATISSCATQPSRGTQQGLLWQVSAPGFHTSYLFGTIHSEDPDVLATLPHITPSLEQSGAFAMEVVLTPQVAKTAADAMYYHNGKTLLDTAGPELYQRSIKALAKKGFQEDYVRYLKPWSVFTILSMPEPKTGEFMDVRLMNDAKRHNISINGLETIEDQLDVFDGMPEQQQLVLLRDTLDHLADMDKLMDQTVQAYLSRDLAQLDQLNRDYLVMLDANVRETFLDRLIYHRNQNMLIAMLPLMQRDSTFVAVGALHLAGDKGLLSLLKQRGFTVTPVY